MKLLFGQLPNLAFPFRSHPTYSLVGSLVTPIPPIPPTPTTSSGGRHSKAKPRLFVKGKIDTEDKDFIEFIQIWTMMQDSVAITTE